MRAEGRKRREIVAKAGAYLRSDEYVFSEARASDPALVILRKAAQVLAGIRPREDAASIARRLEEALRRPVKEIVADERFLTVERLLWDSLYASAIDVETKAANREEIVRLLRAAGILRAMADEMPDNARELHARLSATPVLPRDLFGGPRRRPRDVGEPGPPIEPGRVEDRWSEELLTGYRALEELRLAFRTQQEPEPKARARAQAKEPTGEPEALVSESDPPDRRWTLTPEAVKRLSAATQRVLTELQMSASNDSIPEIESRLEQYLRQRIAALYGGRAKTVVKPYGRNLASEARDPVGANEELFAIPGLRSLAVQARSMRPTIDSTVTDNAAAGPNPPQPTMGVTNVLGIGDLLVVEEELQKYEAGEISYIENVMKTEKRDRVHRQLERTEETITTETEQTEETQRDLQTSDRYELQQEAQNTIQNDTSLDIGVTVSGSLGPVKTEVNSDFAVSSSTTTSMKSATTYAREVIDKSVEKIIQRVREERTVTTLLEVEETNTHTFDNISGSDHVVGIYRWVNKILKAQVVNYGERLMLEFLVPEPAAFFLYAHSKHDFEGVKLEKPVDPGSLSPSEITSITYDTWVSQYNVADVTPPPALYKVVGVAANAGYQKGLDFDVPVTTTLKELQIPSGYAASKAYCHVTKSYVKEKKTDKVLTFAVRVGNNLFDKSIVGDTEVRFDNNLGDFASPVPVSVFTQNIAAWTLNLEVLCERTDEAYDAWKLDTYQKIMNAYASLKAAYDRQVSQAQAAIRLEAPNLSSEAKRVIERTELQKSCLTLFAGEDFREYNAMQLTSPRGYPEFSLSEAQAEGSRVQFFQQAFEWDQMTYLFYPYFWGRKKNWVDRLKLDDVDPVFAGFLKAGYARVVVPVRPAYDDAVLFFLSSDGVIWNGGEAPVLEDELYVSIVDELKKDPGTIEDEPPWEVVLPTTLVILDAQSTLPDWTSLESPATPS
jgi:hypothetical protein